MTKFVALRAKTYSFLIDEYTDEDYGKNKIVNKKAKGKNKVMRDQVKHNKDKLKMDDFLSALMDRSKNLRSNIDIYNDKLKKYQ